MMGRTHALLGVASLWLLQPLPDALTASSLAPLTAAASLGALLPDLDASSSTLKGWRIGGLRPLAPLAALLHRTLGHRGLLHSLWGFVAAALLLSPLGLWEWRLWLGLCLGYASHLAGDACTKSGIPLLYPNRRRWHLLPPGLRLSTGSQAEEVVLVALACLDLLLLLRFLSMALPFAALSTSPDSSI